MTRQQFSFGKNWQQYVQHALTQEKVRQARGAFHILFKDIDFTGKTFLDVGFGQGLALFFAQEMGAKVLGIDNDPENVAALKMTAAMFEHCEFPNFRITSILDDSFIQEQLQKGQFDLVHSWGVLHHTGNMRKAIENTVTLVKPGGFLVLAIYNRHWTSPIWRWVKWSYNKSPEFLQYATIYGFCPIIYIAKWFVTRKNPTRSERGMGFFYNVIDWIGGYPYEYARISEIQELVCSQNFRCVRILSAKVPTGCNQFVFQKQ